METTFPERAVLTAKHANWSNIVKNISYITKAANAQTKGLAYKLKPRSTEWYVQDSTVRYAITSISIVRSCEWYQNSELYRTTFLGHFYWGNTVVRYIKGGARLTAELTVDWSLACATRGMTTRGEWSISFTRSAMLLVACWACLHESAQIEKIKHLIFSHTYTQTMLRFLLHARMTLIATFWHKPRLSSKGYFVPSRIVLYCSAWWKQGFIIMTIG